MTEKDYVRMIIHYLKQKNSKQVFLMDFFKEDLLRWSKIQQMNMLRALQRSTAVVLDYERNGYQIKTIVQLS